MEKMKAIKPELLIRFLSGEASPEDVEQIHAWREKSAENEQIFNEYKRIWESEYHTLLPGEVLSADWEQIKERIHFGKEHRQLNLWSAFSRIAAIFVLLLAVSAALYTYWNIPGFGRWNAFETGDYVDSLRLPDNSMVFLNNHSSLKYLKNFDDGKRKVSLKGEGYFDVVKDYGNPFLVKTPEDITVEVLGTAFHLDAGKGITNVELNVTEGRVALQYYGNTGIVEAGKSARIEEKTLKVFETSNNNFLSWKTGELVFSQDSLSIIARTLAEHYSEVRSVRLLCESEILVTTKFQNEPLVDVLEELEIHFGKKFNLDEGVLTISD